MYDRIILLSIFQNFLSVTKEWIFYFYLQFLFKKTNITMRSIYLKLREKSQVEQVKWDGRSNFY